MDTMPLNDIKLPPGFRFHPSDEELILHYLQNKATSSPLPASIIAEIELYKFNPWELPSKALFGEDEWYFFTPRDRKYPNGVRPNRMAGSGFWKATGTDRPIFSSGKAGVVGVKKALVFYTGKPPRGTKTDWIMHEYRLLEAMPSNTSNSKTKGCMRLDDWVLCRVRQKSGSPRRICQDRYGQYNDSLVNSPRVDQSVNTNPNLELLNATLFKDCPMLPFIFSSDKLDLSSLDTCSSTISFEGSKASTNSGSKFTSVEESFGIQNIPSSDSLTSIHKRKAKEWNNGQEGFVQASKKKHESKEDVTSLISNDAVEMGFYGDQSDQWSYTMGYQSLNDIVFE